MAEDEANTDFSDKYCHSDSDSDFSSDDLGPSCQLILKDGDPLRYLSDLDHLSRSRSPILSRVLPRQARFEGYLYKQGGMNADQGWKHRYMVFDGDSLKYYPNQKTGVSLRIIPVSSMRNLTQLPTAKLSHRHQFSLECVNRTFIFATDDLNNSQTWSHYLMEAIIKYKKQHGDDHLIGGAMSNPDICGVVRLRNKKYFVALKQDKFRYYSNEEDFSGDSPIHELSMKLVSVSEENQTCIRLSSVPGEPPIYLNFDNTKEAMKWKTAIENSIYEAHGDNSIVDQVRLVEGNTTCADCTSTKTHWASVNLGIVLCAKCAGVHRWLGVNKSKVRSLRMDHVFLQNQLLLQLFTEIGNKRANEFWYKSPPSDRVISEGSMDMLRQRHIQQKYVDKQFADVAEYSDTEDLQKDFLEAVTNGNLQLTMRLLNSGADMHKSSDSHERKNAVEMAEDMHHEQLSEYLRQNANIVPEVKSKKDNDKPHTRSVYLENNLEKTGPNMKGFLKRWCVLHNGTITYYADKGGKSIEKGCLCVQDVLSVAVTTCNERKYCFDFSTKDRRRVFRFAAEDDEARKRWVSALVQIIQPPSVVEQPVSDGFQLAGHFYAKFKDSTWHPAWVTLKGKSLRVENVVSETSTLVDMTEVFLVYTFNKGKSKVLDRTPNDFRYLDENQRTEIVIGERLLLIQGIILKDTDRLFTALEEIIRGR